MILHLIVLGKPTGKQEKLFRGPKFAHRYLTKATRQFQDLVRFEAAALAQELGIDETAPQYKGPVAIRLKCYFSKPKSRQRKATSGVDMPRTVAPDNDNLAKAVQDGLSKVLFYDDAQVWKISIEKWETDGTPRTELTIYTEEDAKATDTWPEWKGKTDGR